MADIESKDKLYL